MVVAVRSLLLILSGLISFSSGSSCSDASLCLHHSHSIDWRKVTVLTNSDTAPFVERIGNGVPFGLDIDLMNYIGYIYQTEFRYQFASYPAFIPGVQADLNTISITAQKVTAERLALVDFAPYFRGASGFLVRFNYSQTINGLADLCGKTVTVQLGAIHLLDVEGQNAECRANPIIILPVATLTEELELVANGSADVCVSDRIVLLNAASEFGSNELKVVPASYNLLFGGILCNKGNPQLCCALVNAINYLIQQGTYQKLLKRYSFSLTENGVCPSLLNTNETECRASCRPTRSTCRKILD